MATKKSPGNARENTLQFVDAHGATVTIRPGSAHDYAGVRAEQLNALTRLLVGVSAGDIELDDGDADIFQLWANEYAHAMQELIDLVGRDDGSNNCGGAA